MNDTRSCNTSDFLCRRTAPAEGETQNDLRRIGQDIRWAFWLLKQKNCHSYSPPNYFFFFFVHAFHSNLICSRYLLCSKENSPLQLQFSFFSLRLLPRQGVPPIFLFTTLYVLLLFFSFSHARVKFATRNAIFSYNHRSSTYSPDYFTIFFFAVWSSPFENRPGWEELCLVLARVE